MAEMVITIWNGGTRSGPNERLCWAALNDGRDSANNVPTARRWEADWPFTHFASNVCLLPFSSMALPVVRWGNSWNRIAEPSRWPKATRKKCRTCVFLSLSSSFLIFFFFLSLSPLVCYNTPGWKRRCRVTVTGEFANNNKARKLDNS